MRNLPWIGAGTLGGIAVGLLVGFLIWAPTTRPPGVPPEPVSSMLDARQAASDKTADPPRVDLRIPDEERQTGRPQPVASESSETELPTVFRGDGVLDGVVNLADGSPLPEFTFGLRPSHYPHQLNARELYRLPVEERIAYETVRHRWSEAATLRATTNEEGVFRFEGLVQSPVREQYFLSDIPEGYYLAVTSGTGSGGIHAGLHLELLATPYARVEVRVVQDGRLADSALVNSIAEGRVFGPGSSPAWDRWTRHQPWLEVPIGVQTFNARSATDQHATATKKVEIPVGGLGRPLELNLTRPPGIYVDVHEPPDHIGYAYSYSSYHCVAVAPEQYAPDKEFRDLQRAGVRMGWGGKSFSYPNPPHGRFVIVVFEGDGHMRGRTIAAEEVQFAGESIHLDVHVPEWKEEDYVIVRVTGPDGTPVNKGLNFRFRLHSLDRPVVSGYPLASNRRDGTWWLERAGILTQTRDYGGQQTEHPGKLELTIGHPQYGEAIVECDLSLRAPVEVRFESPAQLTLHVAGLTEDNARRLVVAIAPQGADIHEALEEAARPRHGVAPGLSAEEQAFGPISPGPKTIVLGWRVRLADNDYGCVILDRRDIVLASGENTAALRVPPLHTLVVSPGERRPHALWIRPAGAASGGVSLSRGENNRWTIDCLPAGEYILGQAGAGQMRVSVPTHGEILLELDPVNAWRVSTLDRDGIAFAKGLRYGDYVTALNNERYEGTTALLEAMRQAAQGTNVTLTVEHDRQTSIITFTGEEFRRAREAGLRFSYQRVP